MERMHILSPMGYACGLVLALLLAAAPATARGQDTPTRSAAVALSRYVPKQDRLFLYLESDGLDAHRAAWEGSSAYKLLVQTRLGAVVEDLAGQAIAAAQEGNPPLGRIRPAELIGLVKLAARRGFAVGCWGENPRAGGVVVMARGAARPEAIRLLEASSRPDGPPRSIAGRTLHGLGSGFSWWDEKGDLVVSSKPEVILSVLDGRAPDAADHPIRAALRKKADGFEPVAVGFLDLTVLPPLPPRAVRLGLDGVKRIELQWGIRDDALMAVVGMVAPRPRRGVLAILDQPTFDVDSLPPLPAGLTGFGVASLDLDRLYGRLIELSEQADPGGGEGLAQFELAIRQRFGFDLRKDVLRAIGPKFALYSQATPAAGEGMAMALVGRIAGLTIAAEARDEALAPNLDKVVEAINLVIRPRQEASRPLPDPSVVGFRKQEAKQPTYILNMPAGSVPPAARMLMRPTLELGPDRLVLAASPAAAERSSNVAALPRDRIWKPVEAFVPMARRLPRDMILLAVSDPRETLPGLVENLPALLPQVNGLFPAVGAAREAARRARCSGNLRQIGLAMFNYMNSHNGFPEPGLPGKDGKPTLSWRVALLPYLERQALYERFHLDEPWDGPHNKALIREMPALYGCPDRAGDAPGMTSYRLLVGPGALFEAGRRKNFQAMTDGNSRTIMVVEAAEAVPWTRPDSDLPFDPKAAPSLFGAGSPHPRGFHALFADGTARFLPGKIAATDFRSLITCAGGEVIDWKKLRPPPDSPPVRTAGPLHVEPALLPRADELRPLLFPASTAITSDGEAIRLIARQPIPTPSSPVVGGAAVALLLPAVQAAREADRRSRCVDNLERIALAMQHYHDANGHFPAAIVGKDGKRLLSWRVAILPDLDQKSLYDRFRLDEPWDGPHNKALLGRMPSVFACPGRPTQAGLTSYRGFEGKGAFFEKGQEISVANIMDGVANTIMVVEAKEAVPWTDPDSDLPFDPMALFSLDGAGSPHPGGFHAAMADGSIRFLNDAIHLGIFRALITRAGGEGINGGAF